MKGFRYFAIVICGVLCLGGLSRGKACEGPLGEGALRDRLTETTPLKERLSELFPGLSDRLLLAAIPQHEISQLVVKVGNSTAVIDGKLLPPDVHFLSPTPRVIEHILAETRSGEFYRFRVEAIARLMSVGPGSFPKTDVAYYHYHFHPLLLALSSEVGFANLGYSAGLGSLSLSAVSEVEYSSDGKLFVSISRERLIPNPILSSENLKSVSLLCRGDITFQYEIYLE